MLIARRAINAIVGRWGYELKDKALPPWGLGGFVSYLRSRGFRPDIVLDIGVGKGTPGSMRDSRKRALSYSRRSIFLFQTWNASEGN